MIHVIVVVTHVIHVIRFHVMIHVIHVVVVHHPHDLVDHHLAVANATTVAKMDTGLVIARPAIGVIDATCVAKVVTDHPSVKTLQ